MDASNVGAGAVLVQADCQGMKHPIIYFSQKFNEITAQARKRHWHLY